MENIEIMKNILNRLKEKGYENFYYDPINIELKTTKEEYQRILNDLNELNNEYKRNLELDEIEEEDEVKQDKKIMEFEKQLQEINKQRKNEKKLKSSLRKELDLKKEYETINNEAIKLENDFNPKKKKMNNCIKKLNDLREKKNTYPEQKKIINKEMKIFNELVNRKTEWITVKSTKSISQEVINIIDSKVIVEDDNNEDEELEKRSIFICVISNCNNLASYYFTKCNHIGYCIECINKLDPSKKILCPRCGQLSKIDNFVF